MEKLKIQEINASDGSIIKLNVGGQYFTTSKATLLADKNSVLGAMFSGYHEVTKSSDGSYFIDADGTYFHIILNFLRGRITDVSELPKDEEALVKVRAEADFYQLSTLMELITAALAKGPRISQKWVNDFFIYGFGGWITSKSLNFVCQNLDNIGFLEILFRHNVTFRNSSLVGASFEGSNFRDVTVDFTSADIKNCNFRGVYFNKTCLESIKRAKNIDKAHFDEDVKF